MQQIYQQQMQAQVNTTLTNEEKKSSGLEIPDVSSLSLDSTALASDDLENGTDAEKSDFDAAPADPPDDGEEHQCSEECGFCSEEESKYIYRLTIWEEAVIVLQSRKRQRVLDAATLLKMNKL
jgi:hypothetical protein